MQLIKLQRAPASFLTTRRIEYTNARAQPRRKDGRAAHALRGHATHVASCRRAAISLETRACGGCASRGGEPRRRQRRPRMRGKLLAQLCVCHILSDLARRGTPSSSLQRRGSRFARLFTDLPTARLVAQTDVARADGGLRHASTHDDIRSALCSAQPRGDWRASSQGTAPLLASAYCASRAEHLARPRDRFPHISASFSAAVCITARAHPRSPPPAQGSCSRSWAAPPT